MTNLINLHLQEILDKQRINLLKSFIYFKNNWFILAWWTGLALLFWHRMSEDFDFFISNDFDTDELFKKCLEIFKDFEVIKTYEEKNTLYISVNWVKISFFAYKYKTIWNIINTQYFNIFSIDDISTMKLWAIQNRATNKDYVDLYYIIRKIWLKKVLQNFFDRFWNIVTESYLLKSLVYFDDVNEEKLVLKDKNTDFEKVKNYLKNEIKKY